MHLNILNTKHTINIDNLDNTYFDMAINLAIKDINLKS